LGLENEIRAMPPKEPIIENTSQARICSPSHAYYNTAVPKGLVLSTIVKMESGKFLMATEMR